MTEVFAVMHPVRRRNSSFGAGCRYRVQLIARGTGTEMYASKACDSELGACKLAQAYLRRSPWLLDTTEPKRWQQWEFGL